ncbi:MAG: glucuronate isomerase [Lachnospiraceae bacterium]|nr:glucuronate isomerase [Lachnospiraceae bacterium]
MKYTFLLTNKTAAALYDTILPLPIVDYHCHLSPQEIFEDRQFENIGKIWLGGDHYKWRLMRIAGIPEEQITGNADWKEKFIAYAKALEFSPGNPLYAWSHMELMRYFGIDAEIREDSAEAIYEAANRVIRERKLSPRKLILESKAEILCTTDDPADPLTWHEKIREDKSFPVRVLPSFRPDNALLLTAPSCRAYLEKLGASSGVRIGSVRDLKQALDVRIRYFAEHGCRIADVGIPVFPDRIGTEEEAEAALSAALGGTAPEQELYRAFLGNLFVWLAKEYRTYGIVSQLHLAAERNTNTRIFRSFGPDAGCDTAGDAVIGKDLIRILDAEDRNDGLPTTLLYPLNDSNLTELGSIAGAFRNVKLSAAWWFNDHESGIRKQLAAFAETGSIGSFYGMLTDSRSFLSYARHDYFRQILSSVLGEWVERGELSYETAERIARKVAYENVREVFS